MREADSDNGKAKKSKPHIDIHHEESRGLMSMSIDSSPRCRRGTLPLLEEEIIIDGQFGAKVMVFPKVKALGGTIDPDKMIEEPMEQCRRIFVRERNLRSSRQTIDTSFDAFLHSPVSALLYHEVVRAKLLQVLQRLGLQVRSFDSIDGDETFITVWLDHEGEVIKHLAQRYEYTMPFKFISYLGEQPSGTYPGGQPMQNLERRPVVAYAAYSKELHDKLESFREIDVIRIMELYMDEWVNLEELRRQNIICCAFTAANYDEVKDLHQQWGSLSKIWQLPGDEHIDSIRNYFGEEVAFFFRWFAFYIRMLIPLACAGFACGFSAQQIFHLNIVQRRYMQIVYIFVLIGWASVYNVFFKHNASRDRQRWGMNDHEPVLLERVSFEPRLEGTLTLRFRKLLAAIIPVVYCILFVGVVQIHEELKKMNRENDIRWFADNKYLSNAILIKVFSLLWAPVAPIVANLQNHRTQGRWNDSIIGHLGLVKLFVTLFPFLYEAFLKGHLNQYCGLTLVEAAGKIYGNNTVWPQVMYVNGTVEEIHESSTGASLLEGYFTNTTGDGVCISGCFPQKCYFHLSENETSADRIHCTTNCIIGLKKSLESVYLLHIGCTLAFILIPMALTRIEIEREVLKEKAEGKYFSLLQFQAKSCLSASYEYFSWGGSQVEDFLELAIGFALLTCFGVVWPELSILALFIHIVEYRLLACRMTNITCRPFPHSSEGIGHWESMFGGISLVAVATNVGLAVTQMSPMRSWEPTTKLTFFIFLEHSLIGVYVILAHVFPEEPQDVVRIEDFNDCFKRKFHKEKPFKVPHRETCDLAEVDLRLRPDLSDTRWL